MGEPKLNLGWLSLTGLILLGMIACQAIAHFVSNGSIVNSYLFSAFALYGIIFSFRGIRRGVGFVSATAEHASMATRVLAIATMRREILRGIAHLNVLLIGILSLDPPSWFGKFFVAAMFFLVYTMDVNSTLDDTLRRRVQHAQAIDKTKAEG